MSKAKQTHVSAEASEVLVIPEGGGSFIALEDGSFRKIEGTAIDDSRFEAALKAAQAGLETPLKKD